MSELLIVTAVALAALYAAMCASVYFRQHAYMYSPAQDIDTTPEDVGLAFEPCTIATPDGEQLACWWVPAPGRKAGATLLFCHGNAGNIGDRVTSIRTFHDVGLDVFIFDYRGFGKSSGTPDEQGTYTDARAAWDHLVHERGLPAGDIIIFGRSLGGAVATELAGHVAPRALVLESTFTSAGDMGADMFPYIPVRYFVRYHYPTLSRLPGIRCPLLIAHSRDDHVVNFRHFERLCAAAPPGTEPMIFLGTHNSGGMDADPDYRHRFEGFLARLPAPAS